MEQAGAQKLAFVRQATASAASDTARQASRGCADSANAGTRLRIERLDHRRQTVAVHHVVGVVVLEETAAREARHCRRFR